MNEVVSKRQTFKGINSIHSYYCRTKISKYLKLITTAFKWTTKEEENLESHLQIKALH